MRSKSILLLLVALGCGTVAAVAVSQTLLERGDKPSGEPTIEILVATQEIKTASQISADRVKLERWPKTRVPEGAIIELTQVEGKYARQGIFPGEPIIAAKLADSNSSLSTQIPAGHTLFNIPFNNNYIKPGDIVDISGVFRDLKTKKTEVIPVLREIQVFAINGIVDREHQHKGGKDTVFQLLIRQEQNQALMLANNLGKLELNLRPLNADGGLKGAPDDGNSFLNWAKENTQEPVPAEEAPKLVSTPAPAPTPEKPKKSEIIIVTPQGIKRYEYSGKDEIPTEVSSKPQSTNPVSSTNPWSSFSGYGGYTPTYPNTSTTAPGPFGDEGAADPNSSHSNGGVHPAAESPNPQDAPTLERSAMAN